MKRLLISFCIVACTVGVFAQTSTGKELQLADSIVKYQMKSGGWPKNEDWLKGADQKHMMECKKTGIGSTIDNDATINEMKALAKAVDKIVEMQSQGFGWIDKDALKEKTVKYQTSFNRGLEYLLEMQYDNGGFPQFYPARKGVDYSSQITFNDNAMMNVMKLLRDIAKDKADFKNMAISKSMKKKCQQSFDKAIQCVLDCQIRVDENGKVLEFGSDVWKKGKRTVWCQQHDRRTLAPCNARAFELASYTGQGETTTLLELLMSVPDPNPDIIDAVKGGVEWLEAHVMKDTALENYTNEEGKKDRRIVSKEGSDVWARYYDLEKAEPFYCDRDGVPVRELSKVGYERRNGYRWIGDSPKQTIKKYHESYAPKYIK